MLIATFIAGTANLIKLSAFAKEVSSSGIEHTIIDIGICQDEYHEKLFGELQLSRPDFVLKTKSSSYLHSLHLTIDKLDKILRYVKPNIFVVFGDLNGIVPACISANKAGVPIAHIEAGLRNGDPYDIEEFNRIFADRFSSIHFTISDQGTKNLIQEGFKEDGITCAGNTIIDSLVNYLPVVDDSVPETFGLSVHQYGLCAIHRENNLSSKKKLKQILNGLNYVQQKTKVLFLVYSSTEKALKRTGLYDSLVNMKNVVLINRQGYINYLSLLKNANFVITDSSGIQDECAYLGVPCLVCLDVTHRFDALNTKNNILVGASSSKIFDSYQYLFSNNGNNKLALEWDGLAAKRITEKLFQKYRQAQL